MGRRGRRAMPLFLMSLVGFLAAGLLVLVLLSRRPPSLGVSEGTLQPCPSSPNCVSSQASDEKHRVAPFDLGEDTMEGFARLNRAVAEAPGLRSLKVNGNYLRAVFRTRILGFEDDLELLVDDEAHVAHVRSASRVGYSDLGANRKRVEAIRSAFESASSE